MSRLLEKYKSDIKTDLMTKLQLKNIHEVPKINKIIVNMGIIVKITLLIFISFNGFSNIS